MEKVEINLGDFFNDTINRLPKNMKEMAYIITNVLQRYEIAMKHGKYRIEINIIKRENIWENGK